VVNVDWAMIDDIASILPEKVSPVSAKLWKQIEEMTDQMNEETARFAWEMVLLYGPEKS